MSNDADRLPLTTEASIGVSADSAATTVGPSLLGSHAAAAVAGTTEPGSILTTTPSTSPSGAASSLGVAGDLKWQAGPSAESSGQEIHGQQESTSTAPTEDGSGFRWADHAQILRAHQRDEAQVARTSDMLSDVLRISQQHVPSALIDGGSSSAPARDSSASNAALRSARFLLSHPRFLPALARLAYYGLTFGAASQTIGEEYVDILPYSTKRSDFPSRRRRAWAVGVLVFAPELLAIVRERMRRGIARRRDQRRAATRAADAVSSRSRVGSAEEEEEENAPLTRRAWLLRLLESKLVTILPELWFAWFLIGGGNVDWSKSLAGLRYISPLAPLPSSYAGPAYQPVGWMVMLSLVAKLWPSTADTTSSATDNEKAHSMTATASGVLDDFRIEGTPALSGSPTAASSAIAGPASDEPPRVKTVLRQDELGVAQRQCPLCLSPRGVATESGGTAVTECGHIFCWSCIHDWADEKMECPLCRQSLRLERLTPAYNL